MGSSPRSESKLRSRLLLGLAIAVIVGAFAVGFIIATNEEGERQIGALSGAQLFQTEFTPEQGLGPLFNEQACSTCHAQPEVGGMGNDGLATVLRVGRLTDTGFDPTFRARRIEAHDHTIAEFGIECERAAGIPARANVTSVRNTPPLFGAGLIDAIPDAVIRAGAVPKGDGVRGRPNLVRGPDGERDVGRFGWKADGPTLELFVAEAFRSELGVTSPLAPAAPLPDGVARCTGETSDPDIDRTVVRAVTDFVAALHAPRTETSTERGELVFEETGCTSCHVPSLDAGSRSVPLYSDLLLHDMGPALDDAVVQGRARGRDWRTTPLWGLSDRTRFLHDGRADDLEEAILAHGGEAETARTRFAALPDAQVRSLLAFLRSL